MCNNESGFFFFSKIYALFKCPRVLRKTFAAHHELCWSNVSLLPESKARACGFSTQATLCEKHFDEKKTKKTNLSLASHYVMMRIFVGSLFYVQGDYFQCSTVSKILTLEHSYVRDTETCS